MNSRNRHLQYRKSVYRRKRLQWVLIIGGAALVVLFLIFIIVGNILGKRSDEYRTDNEEKNTGTSSDISDPLPSLPAVNAYAYLPDDPAFSLSALVESGASAITVPLNHPDGTPRFTSVVKAGGSSSLSALVGTADESGVYVTGVYYLTALADEDDLKRSLALTEAAAEIVEAIRTGVDDVLILLDGGDTEYREELYHLSENVRRLEQNAVLGLALPRPMSDTPETAEWMERFSSAFSYLALDCTKPEGDMPETATSEHVGSMLYYLLRYRMRVLLPYAADAEQQNRLIAAGRQSSVDNWMILP